MTDKVFVNRGGGEGFLPISFRIHINCPKLHVAIYISIVVLHTLYIYMLVGEKLRFLVRFENKYFVLRLGERNGGACTLVA